jgi:hypothetical protein
MYLMPLRYLKVYAFFESHEITIGPLAFGATQKNPMGRSLCHDARRGPNHNCKGVKQVVPSKDGKVRQSMNPIN